MRLGDVSARPQFFLNLGLDLVRRQARRRYVADHQHPNRSVILNGVLAVQLIGPEHPDFEPISWSEVIRDIGLASELRQVRRTTGRGKQSYQRYPQDAEIRVHARAPLQHLYSRVAL